MRKVNRLFSLLTVSCAAVAFVACDDNEDPTPVQAATFSNLNADSGTGRGAQGQVIGATNQFTFFSFKNGAIVSHADSATAKWDLGFRGTTIIVNNTTSGPGTAQVQVVSGVFDQLTEAPESGYKTDNKNAANTADRYAIVTGSGNGWYTYDAANFLIKPTAGKFLVVKTADGHYAKVEIISYYKNAPASPNATSDLDRFYTFRYVYQPNDSKSFQ